jgi:hypothetical protein
MGCYLQNIFQIELTHTSSTVLSLAQATANSYLDSNLLNDFLDISTLVPHSTVPFHLTILTSSIHFAYFIHRGSFQPHELHTYYSI